MNLSLPSFDEEKESKAEVDTEFCSLSAKVLKSE
jgi:hypothetical protein